MKLATFTQDGRTRVGVVEGEEIIDLSTTPGAPGDMVSLLEGAPAYATRSALPLQQLRAYRSPACD